MSPEELKNHLNLQYNIVDMIDLGELTESHSSAYKFFKRIYKDTYEDNERIVLYTQHNLLPQLVSHILSTLDLLGISSFFILFCTASDISPLLKTIQNNDFQNTVVSLDETKDIKNDWYIPGETFCSVPWFNLEVRPNGTITPCCSAKNYGIGNISDMSLSQAMNSEKMQSLRDALIGGTKHQACTSCWMSEERGLTSLRQYKKKFTYKEFLESLDNEPKITSLDIKFNNTCNFSCVICYPEYSSLRAIEDQKYRNIPIRSTAKWSDSDEFQNQVINLLPTLTNIDMFGGEPFLIKKFKNVLEMATKGGYAKDIRLHYNTNGSVWPDAFIEYWPHFKEVDIHFSIDAIGNQFEYQRGGNWLEVEKNILKIKNLNMSNMTINVMPTISILNVYYLDRVIDWCFENEFYSIFENYVTNSSGFNLSNLTKDAKELIYKKYRNYDKWPVMKHIISTIEKLKDSDGKNFENEISYFDRIRGRNYADAHQEFALAMGYKI